MINIKTRKLPWCSPNTLLRGSTQSSGYDLAASYTYEIPYQSVVTIQTGLCLEIPYEVDCTIRPRSGLTKQGVFCQLGTIDADYRGEIDVIVFNNSLVHYCIWEGDRIGQLVFTPLLSPLFQEVEELEKTERDEKGFGSSGK